MTQMDTTADATTQATTDTTTGTTADPTADPTTAASGGGEASDGLLAPVPDEDGAPFFAYAARGELRVQCCADCGEPRFPPRPCCPHCQSFDCLWKKMSGRGRIWSYVLPHPPLLPAYAEQAPYNVVLVELADAPRIRLVGNLVATADAALNSVPPERIRIGAPVKAAFHATDGGLTVVRWLLERP